MLTPITPPETEPVSITQLAQNLIMTTDTAEYTGWESEQLQQHIRAARADAECYTGRYFAEQTVRYSCARFSTAVSLHQDTRAIVKWDYYDTENQRQTYPAEQYFLAGQQLMLKPDSLVPEIYPRPDAVQIDLSVGQNTENIPDVQKAILLIASHWHENREASSPLTIKEVPLSYQYLLNSHKHYIVG